ncbi:MAG: glutamate-cysteine ligase family protein [Cyanophyceae cyanobacterium]
MNIANRRLGLEQEFFLVDAHGALSNQADAFLERCRDAAAHTRPSECFATEFVKSIVEINTLPVHDIAELTEDYLDILQLALKVARELDLRLYPLSTYPLHFTPVVRHKQNALLQVRTVGAKRFQNAAKCTGTHLHLELAESVIDRRLGVAYGSSAEDREELLSVYNLVTALDAALIALSRACPFYDGTEAGMAMRTMHYRGSKEFGWEGVYTHLQPVGGLMPYAETVEDLVEQQFYRYYTWLQAMDEAGVERRLFWDSGGELLKAGWNPVRLNKLGTVELRGMDSNYPEVTLALVTLVVEAANRVRREGITVRPAPVKTFELTGKQLKVPEFSYLNGSLLHSAVTEGVKSAEVKNYIDSIVEFSSAAGNFECLNQLKSMGEYRTTEAELLDKFASPTGKISYEEGLQLVLYCCDRLEKQVESLVLQSKEKALSKSIQEVGQPSN